ncbi:MAG: hypothetical protein V1840_01085, partial [Candidatus Omnitrophota bacterium]
MFNAKTRIANARLGGLRRMALYGNPGTPEGRSKGGKTSVKFFQQNPALAKKLGFVLRKNIKFPDKSAELAEMVGIILGDGGLPGNHQLIISFNSKTDQEYAGYLQSLLKKLFAVDSHVHYRKNNNGADIIVSSSNLVEFLEKLGLLKGNKVKNQVAVPGWINEKLEYRLACLCGLMDTDGGLYLHRYNSNGKVYKYMKLCFTNCSRPLLDFVFKVLKSLNFKVYLNGAHVSVYAVSEVKRY